MSEKMEPFTYDGPPPVDYKCDDCGAHGVRLYRGYQTFASKTRLLCTACAEVAGDEPRKVDPDHPDSIGWFVAAVPTEDGETFWGFTSVPWKGVYWWRALPAVAGERQPASALIAWLLYNTSGMQTLLDIGDKRLERRDSEIATLISQMDDLKGALDASDDQHRAALAEISRLRSALKPFAEFAKPYLPNSDALEYPEHVSAALIHTDAGPVTIEVGHLRAALKALEET